MTAEHTYTFDDKPNSYFMGSDVHVTRDDGKTIVINGKDRMCAIRVKDHKGSYLGDLSNEERALAEDLNKANVNRFHAEFEGMEYTDTLYDRSKMQWWDDANYLATEYDFECVWSAGRSGGWCCVQGTNEEDGARIMRPEDDDDREFQTRFFGLAFDLMDLIEQTREQWVEQIKEEHAQLERERTESIILGEN